MFVITTYCLLKAKIVYIINKLLAHTLLKGEKSLRKETVLEISFYPIAGEGMQGSDKARGFEITSWCLLAFLRSNMSKIISNPGHGLQTHEG